MSERKYTDEDLDAALGRADLFGFRHSPACSIHWAYIPENPPPDCNCAKRKKVEALAAFRAEACLAGQHKAIDLMTGPTAYAEGFAAALEKAARVVRKAPRTGESNARMRILEDAIRALTPEEPKP